MSYLLLVFFMTTDGLRIEHIKEPDMQTCKMRAIDLNGIDSVKADCVEVSND
jgi:hypothetical protein